MEMSNTKLFGALLAAQRAFGKVIKDSLNPHLKNKYAGLDSVLDAIRDPLLDAGIVLMQPATDTGERGEHGEIKVATVKTILVHAESGEQYEIQTSIPLPKNDAQGYGSAVTYARRYALMGLLGLAPEDDDGNAASTTGTSRTTASGGQQPARQQTANRTQAQGQKPTLEKALKKIEETEAHRLDFALQWCKVNFEGDELKKLESAIEAKRQALAANGTAA